ncbi:MAG: hypothetical protein FWG90_08070 [Oscillospiraceae bacterium]|nr:hypothetical protein [Oscillospiraceae bacterium]
MYQTMEEIEKQYDGNFVCFINCKWTEFNGFLGGEVIAYGKDKFEIQDMWFKNPDSYYRFIGEFPDEAGGYLL